MKAIPKIQKYMTTTPYAINAESTVEEAAKLMREHEIRHLPVVVVEGKKYGILSDRDVKYAMSLSGFDARRALVRDIYEEIPYITAPSTLINEVSAEMAERKVGSALIVDNGHLVGIFTTTDACRALNDLCQTRLN
jgi:acetoin utilization protein AcuB